MWQDFLIIRAWLQSDGVFLVPLGLGFETSHNVSHYYALDKCESQFLLLLFNIILDTDAKLSIKWAAQIGKDHKKVRDKIGSFERKSYFTAAVNSYRIPIFLEHNQRLCLQKAKLLKWIAMKESLL